MIYGYARVSTQDQNLDLQLDALKIAGANPIFQEKLSAIKKERPEFESLLKIVKRGDAILVWKLDRFGRSLKELINTYNPPLIRTRF